MVAQCMWVKGLYVALRSVGAMLASRRSSCAAGANDEYVDLRSAGALRGSRRVLAPLVAAAAALWLPPAAKED